jgi:MYXO-CTERM domain-containing protein
LRNAGHITDHIKIAGVDFVKQTTEDVPVSAPGVLALFGAGIFLMLRRRK